MLAVAGAALLLLYILDTIRVYRRLAHIPGPPTAGFSRLWLLRAHTSGRLHEDMYNVLCKYGSLVRIGPNHLLTSDHNHIRRMNAIKSPYRRAPWYGVFRLKPRHDNILTTISEERHDALRKKMAGGYSGKEVPHIEEHIDNRIQEWVEQIRWRYISTNSELKPMDLGRASQYFTLDVISDLAFDQTFGDIAADKDQFDYMKTTGEAITIIAPLTVFPRLHKWIEGSRLLDFLAPSAKDKVGFGRILGISAERVASRFGPDARKTQDMLGSFIRHGLTQEEAESEAVLQM